METETRKVVLVGNLSEPSQNQLRYSPKDLDRMIEDFLEVLPGLIKPIDGQPDYVYVQEEQKYFLFDDHDRLHSSAGRPAVIMLDGHQEWYNHGELIKTELADEDL